ncbi:ubiquinone biosynthesis protein, ABC1 family [Enterococcus canis]|uniref:Ubiquinone biosynthesis protein, ABC1 family n=1 Tax=Enterococcus canis TaxID=214095 RepID=A0A1L8RDT1_9ENTE|nr:AarF/UbiB family protein [Enterococcus canis]OJG17875.1 ubiquinone biosynthesis protein, ABC1 family [Enterococcus canis]
MKKEEPATTPSEKDLAEPIEASEPAVSAEAKVTPANNEAVADTTAAATTEEEAATETTAKPQLTDAESESKEAPKAERTASAPEATTSAKPKKESQRFREIMRIMRQYKILPRLARQKEPEQVRKGLEALGPTFIKIGQMLSVRTDIMSPEFVQELQKLQDNVAVDPPAVARQTMVQELGRPIEDVFQQFNDVPFASASIGQTHEAVLISGERVAVKLQHPSIQEDIRLDLSLLKRALPLLKIVPDGNVVDAKAVVAEVERSLLSEVDYAHEAANGRKFYEANNNWEIIETPYIYEEYCTSRLLVMEFKKGRPLNQYLSHLADEDPKIKQQLGDVLVRNFIKQVFVDGFFHADPHPGNLLIRSADPLKRNGKDHPDLLSLAFRKGREKPVPYRLVYLDFGMMGRLDQQMVTKLSQVITSLYFKNMRDTGAAILAICQRTGPVDEENFIGELATFLEEYYNLPIGQMDFQLMFMRMIDICSRNNLRMDSAVTMLIKAFATLEGVVEQLDPELSMVQVAIPFAQMYLQEKFDWQSFVRDVGWQALATGKSLPKLPERAVSALDTFNAGQARLNIEVKQKDELFDGAERLVNRLVAGLVLAAVIMGSSMLVEFSPDPTSRFATKLGLFGYGISLLTIIGLVGRALWKRWQNWRKRRRF